MLKRISLPASFLLTLLLVGCGSENTSNSNAAANTNRTAVTTSIPAPITPAPPTMAPVKIGIAECDSYIARFDACISDHVPEAARAPYKASLEAQRTQWQRLAANPQTKAGLAQACKTAAEQQRTAMKSFKCTF